MSVVFISRYQFYVGCVIFLTFFISAVAKKGLLAKGYNRYRVGHQWDTAYIKSNKTFDVALSLELPVKYATPIYAQYINS